MSSTRVMVTHRSALRSPAVFRGDWKLCEPRESSLLQHVTGRGEGEGGRERGGGRSRVGFEFL